MADGHSSLSDYVSSHRHRFALNEPCNSRIINADARAISGTAPALVIGGRWTRPDILRAIAGPCGPRLAIAGMSPPSLTLDSPRGELMQENDLEEGPRGRGSP